MTTEHDDADAVVIQLDAFRLDRVKPAATVKTGVRCRHRYVEVYDDGTQRVRCKECDQHVEAHTVLLGFARKEASFVYGMKHAKAEVERLEKEIEELKRVRSNLMAQNRRFAKRNGDG